MHDFSLITQRRRRRRRRRCWRRAALRMCVWSFRPSPFARTGAGAERAGSMLVAARRVNRTGRVGRETGRERERITGRGICCSSFCCLGITARLTVRTQHARPSLEVSCGTMSASSMLCALGRLLLGSLPPVAVTAASVEVACESRARPSSNRAFTSPLRQPAESCWQSKSRVNCGLRCQRTVLQSLSVIVRVCGCERVSVREREIERQMLCRS